jgi:hypothetical protein
MGRYQSIVGEISRFELISVYLGQSGASTYGGNTTGNCTSYRIPSCPQIPCELLLGLRGREIECNEQIGAQRSQYTFTCFTSAWSPRAWRSARRIWKVNVQRAYLLLRPGILGEGRGGVYGSRDCLTNLREASHRVRVCRSNSKRSVPSLRPE